MSKIPGVVIEAQTQHLADEVKRLTADLSTIRQAARALRDQLADHPKTLTELRAVAGEEWDELMRQAEAG